MVSDGDPDPLMIRGKFCGEMGRRNLTYRGNVASFMAKQLNRSSCRLE